MSSKLIYDQESNWLFPDPENNLVHVVDKKVKTEGKRVKPTFTNFRTLESFLAEREPDELDYIKTGIRKYEQTDYADVEVD